MQELIQKSDAEGISKILGFENSIAFSNYGINLNKHFQRFVERFPSLLDDDSNVDFMKLRAIIKRHQQNREAEYLPISSPNGRTAVSFVCTRKYSDCRSEASTDLAISTSQCLGLAIFPPAYVICRSVAFVSYSIDMSGCNDGLTICMAAYE